MITILLELETLCFNLFMVDWQYSLFQNVWRNDINIFVMESIANDSVQSWILTLLFRQNYLELIYQDFLSLKNIFRDENHKSMTI